MDTDRESTSETPRTEDGTQQSRWSGLSPYRVVTAALRPINAVPIAILVGLGLLLLWDPTDSAALWLLQENRPIEVLSFFAALAAAVVSIGIVRRHGKDDALVKAFFLLFGAAMFFLAMEEISWGQQFLKFDTPDSWQVRNNQNETTLHNYEFDGTHHLEIYPFLFGVCGGIGVILGALRVLPSRITPPLWMWPWFAAVALHSGIDLVHEYRIPSEVFDDLINDLDEAAEMLVAISGLTFALAKRNVGLDAQPVDHIAGRSAS